MAEHAHITHITTGTPLEDTLAITGRRRFGAGLLAVVAGSGITAGVAASVADIAPVDPAADLIEACAWFSAIEFRCNEIDNAARTLEQEDRAEVLTAELRGEANGERHWPALDRICTTPGSSHAAAIALASALAVWKTGAVVAGEDDPDDYVGDRITAALLRCLLGSASA